MRPLSLAVTFVLAPPLFAQPASDGLLAGRWEQSIEGTGVTVDGKPAPPDVAAGMTRKSYVCISPQEAADPKEYFSDSNSKECVDMKVDHAPGRIAISAACAIPPGIGEVRVTGTYTAGSYRFDMTAAATAEGKPPLNMTAIMSGKHVGVCDGSEEK